MSEIRENGEPLLQQNNCCSKATGERPQPSTDSLLEDTVVVTDEQLGFAIIVDQDKSQSARVTAEDVVGHRTPTKRSEHIAAYPERCQCATMDKPKDRKPASKTSHVSIDKQRYACHACYSGHRTGRCQHIDKPLMRVRKAGRPPKNGKKDDEDVKCECRASDCQKCEGQCACSPCVCTRKMFIVVYMSVDESGNHVETRPTFKEGMDGEFRISKEVWTDLTGNELTPEEREARLKAKQLLMQRPKNPMFQTPATPALPLKYFDAATPVLSTIGNTPALSTFSSGPLSPGTDFTMDEFLAPTNNDLMNAFIPFNPGPAPPVLNVPGQNFANIGMPQIDYTNLAMMPPQPSIVNTGSASCCGHRNTVVQNEYQSQTPNMLRGCNCGDRCTCVHCPEHPQNTQTMDFMAGTMQYIRSQNLPSPHMAGLVHLGAPYASARSCMGSTQMAYAQSSSHDDTAYGAYQHASSAQKAALIYQFDGRNMYPSAQSLHTRVGDTWVSHGVVQTKNTFNNDCAYQLPPDPHNLPLDLTHRVENMDWDQQMMPDSQGPVMKFSPAEVPNTWDEILDESSKIHAESMLDGDFTELFTGDFRLQ